MLETSDETAVDSLEPELADISSDRSVRELVAEEQIKEATTTASNEYLRRPEFRVDPVAQAEFEAELLMTPEEADSLLSSRCVPSSEIDVSLWTFARLFRDNCYNALRALALCFFVLLRFRVRASMFHSFFILFHFPRYLLSARHAASGTNTT